MSDNVNERVAAELQLFGVHATYEYPGYVSVPWYSDGVEFHFATSDLNDTWTVDLFWTEKMEHVGGFDSQIPSTEQDAVKIARLLTAKMQVYVATFHFARCIKCGNVRLVCCDHSYEDLGNGSTRHEDAYCVYCCPISPAPTKKRLQELGGQQGFTLTKEEFNAQVQRNLAALKVPVDVLGEIHPVTFDEVNRLTAERYITKMKKSNELLYQLTAADVDVIVEGIEQFIIGPQDTPELNALWQPYIDKLTALKDSL